MAMGTAKANDTITHKSGNDWGSHTGEWLLSMEQETEPPIRPWRHACDANTATPLL